MLPVRLKNNTSKHEVESKRFTKTKGSANVTQIKTMLVFSITRELIKQGYATRFVKSKLDYPLYSPDLVPCDLAFPRVSKTNSINVLNSSNIL